MWLDSSGKQLIQWPIEELETLRGDKVQIKNHKLKMGEQIEIKGITAIQVCYLNLTQYFSLVLFILFFLHLLI